MPIRLYGLNAQDRTEEEQKAVDEVMGYEDKEPELLQIDFSQKDKVQDTIAEPKPKTSQNMFTERMARDLAYQQYLDKKYEEALEQQEQKYGTKRKTINTNAEDYIKGIANEVSSHYKKFKGTDKLPLTNQDYKQISADYDARKQVYGEDNANIWLDSKFKDIVGENQGWFEQAVNSVSHLIPAIEGGMIQAAGNVWGIANHLLGTEGYEGDPNLNPIDRLIDAALDNSITRYGRDLEHAGASHITDPLAWLGLTAETADEKIASTKASATKYNPEGIGNDAIITTSEQDRQLVHSSTPWEALQSGGFTALSMLVGAGEAAAARALFGWAARGANTLNKGVNLFGKTARLIKTEESLEKTLEGIKKVQNFTDTYVIPGAVGSMEGAIEGLNTKIEVEREATDKLDNYYKEKVEDEAVAIYNNLLENYNENAFIEVPTEGGGKRMVKMPKPDYNQVFKEVWEKYKDEYIASRAQIDWASSKAGIQNFWANSLINGMLNQTLKAGIMAPSVQESIRNNRMFGWAYKNPAFKIDANGVVTPKMSKAGAVAQMLKEPAGEGLEEALQSISNDTFSGAAETNIDEFIKRKFNGDSAVKVTDTFGSELAAAMTAFTNSLTNKETIQSAILGAISSGMGTVGGIGTGYHRDDNGRLVQNSTFSPRNLTRGLNAQGQKEGVWDYISRVTPWRSGLINAYYDRRKEEAEAKETAATLTEWLKNPQNKAKWDGLQGTAGWLTNMQKAIESNDQFGYRNSQMGNAINDVFMLSKLKGTDYYDAVMTDLQRASEGNVTNDDIQKIRENGGDEYLGKSDQEIVEKIQSNANKMLGLMSTVEKESRNLDRLVGRIDEDNKQSLIFGKVMEQDFKERRDQLQEEVDAISHNINSSVKASNVDVSEAQLKVILAHGGFSQALKDMEKQQKKVESLKEKVSELEAIDKKKMSPAQLKQLEATKVSLKREEKKLNEYDALYERDDKGKKTDQIDHTLSQLVLNEEEIMRLDDKTRALVFLNGAAKFYNATHQDRQKVDALNLQIDEIDKQIEKLEAQKASWMINGRVKKGHNKQASRNSKQIAELQKQKDSLMRELDAEQGSMDNKPTYSTAQQEVIDNLIQQGTAQDMDFVDKVVDMGRLEDAIKNYHTQYQAILSDPKVFQNYVRRVKFNAQRDITRRRAERVAGIQDYKEYAQELDKLTANASDIELMDIMNTLREEDERQKKEYQKANSYVDEETGEQHTTAEPLHTNYDRYKENWERREEMESQFAKIPGLTDNDMSLLIDAMQYLSSNGVDVTDREAAVSALVERDDEGVVGGKFRQYVESKNDALPDEQKAFMPTFTSTGQVVSQYVDLINGVQRDRIIRENINPVVSTADDQTAQTASSQSTVSPTPSPNSSGPVVSAAAVTSPTIFNIGGATPESGHFVDNDGTVATDAQVRIVQDRQDKQDEQKDDVDKSEMQRAFEQVTTPGIAAMVDVSSHVIESSNAPQEEKDTALQYLREIAVNTDERYETLDDMIEAIQSQIDNLQDMANQEENDNNVYKGAAVLLQKVYNSLKVKKERGGRMRTLPLPGRAEDPNAGIISSANIAFIQSKNPDAWPVRFTEEHNIDNFVNTHWPGSAEMNKETPVYFITNSEWTAEATAGLDNYNWQNNMPVVAAVKVAEPTNPNKTTAVEVNGEWYQPIAVLPSTDADKTGGSRRTESIRKKASQEQGIHLITQDGLPNSSPLISYIASVKAHDPDQSSQTKRENTKENNKDVTGLIIDFGGVPLWEKAQTMTRGELLGDSQYQETRNVFLNGLTHEKSDGKEAIIYTKNRLTVGPDGKPEAGTVHMEVYRKPLEETKDRDTGSQTLQEVIEEGNNDKIRAFNSRTQRLYDEVIRPIFQYIPGTRVSPVKYVGDPRDISAKVITQDDVNKASKDGKNAFDEEAKRLTKLLNGFERGSHGVNDFLWLTSGWEFKVTAPEQDVSSIDKPTTKYKVSLVNNAYDPRNPDPAFQPIILGTIQAGQNDTDAAFELLKNILWDSEKGQIRDFLRWQVPYSDIEDINNPDMVRQENAKRNIRSIIDDGILEIPGSSLGMEIDGVKIYAPIASDSGRIIYPTQTVSNPSNATPAAPQNITPKSEGATLAGDGQTVEPNSGTVLDTTPPVSPTAPVQQESQKLKDAKELTERIVADSKEFTLSEDETHYYITDKATGEKVKYLRVTTVIGADESVKQWEPEIKDILDKLKGRFTIADSAYHTKYESTKDMSAKLGIPVADIRRATAELRTVHKHEGYGAWGTPSTVIGDTFDDITRDFFAGQLKDSYVNVSKEVLDTFVRQLQAFKYELDARGIHIVPNGVMAHGTITMADEDGNVHDAKVAGTLDLFGYDDHGDFYIFDMKTTRDHSEEKLEKEKAKWSRQISMYADLLKQSYPGFDISEDNLRIIPINVDYPAPEVWDRRSRRNIPVKDYRENKETKQLQVSEHGKDDYKDYTMQMPENSKESNGDNAIGMRSTGLKGQYQPGYTPFRINWDNLSSEDQDIADNLVTQTSDSSFEAKPQSATIETPEPIIPSVVAPDAYLKDDLTQSASTASVPIIPSGTQSHIIAWKDLTSEQKKFLKEQWGITTFEEYNEEIRNPADAEALYGALGCAGLL